ncbi:MAG: RraA family protein [Actinobacteria bacterium]|nr:RraA family protein [Actinomycetota bacterium]
MARGAPDDRASRFSALYTGAVTDVLDRMGLLSQTLPSELLPLQSGMRLAGPAYTIEGRPRPGNDYDSSIRKILAMLGSVPKGHVAVYQTYDLSAAHLGELSVTSLNARGCVGAVIDGGCRDIEYILRERFPVFCRYTTPQDCVVRWDLIAENAPVTIGGVRISPGDYIVADDDGIVAVPAEVCDAVLAEAEEKVAAENDVRDAVRGGALPLEAYDRYGTF